MEFSTANDWLNWIASLHSAAIDLGLDRVKVVAKHLDLLHPTSKVIIVGGTNGKGSTVAGLEAIYRAAGYRVGAFTSPYLLKPHEQIRLDGALVDDKELCQTFATIESARTALNVSLTQFEFFTLAAFLIFKTHLLDVWILEVGLGGRLDAVNVWDADVAIVTSIDLDHMDWLGQTRERIAHEKVGIFRAHKPAICGDPHPPVTLMEDATKLGTTLYMAGRDFCYQEFSQSWNWECGDIRYEHLPLTKLATQNMAIVLMAITLLQPQLPVPRSAIDRGFSTVDLPARIQVVSGPVTTIYDVAHNPAAIKWLTKRLKQLPCAGKTLAVFSMLGEKDINASVAVISDTIDQWFVAPLTTKRAASLAKIIHAFKVNHIKQTFFFTSIAEAYQKAKQLAETGDRIVIFGSFHTVAEVYACEM